MTKKSFITAEEIFQKHDGVLRTAEAKRLGIHQPILSQMVEAGLLVKEGRGIYRLSQLEPPTDPDLFKLAIRFPDGVFCLVTALYLHNLTTHVPHKVYISLPLGARIPKSDVPPLVIITPTDRVYREGIESRVQDGILLKLYNKEKTIADCFKFRSKVGMDVAIDALKDYLSKRDYDVQKLFHFAKINRVMKIMYPYVEAIV